MEQNAIECGRVVDVRVQRSGRKFLAKAVVTATHERDIVEVCRVLVNGYALRMFPRLFSQQDVEVLDTRPLLLPTRLVIPTSERWSLEKVEEALDQYSILRNGLPLPKRAKEMLAEKFSK